MVDEHEANPWFEFRIEETGQAGVEIDKLTRVLQELRATFLAIARAKLGNPTRPGRHSVEEHLLSDIRIMRVLPGSTIIQAEPPTVAQQQVLSPLGDEPTADDVAYDLLREMELLQLRQRSLYSRPEVRSRVHSLIRSAAEIGKVAEIVHRPQKRVGDVSPNSVVRTRLSTEQVDADPATEIVAQPRRRRVSGRAYMVDVEPGRWRLRVKLPDGRDLTLDASEELAQVMRGAVDRVVEIESVEELVGDSVASRTAVNLHLLPTAGAGSTKPPKTVAELAAEQGMPGERPDYGALASAVWQSDDDLAAFESHLARSRQSA